MLIAVCANSPQAGKSTFCEHLRKNYNFVTLTFAEPMKVSLWHLLYYRNIEEERINAYLYGDKKEEIIPELGITARNLMIEFAHTFVRGRVANDFFIDCVRTQPSFLPQQFNYVIEDLRYQNEIKFLRENGGILVFIKRFDMSSFLVNEGLITESSADYVINNTSSIQDFYVNIENIMKELGQPVTENSRAKTKTLQY